MQLSILTLVGWRCYLQSHTLASASGSQSQHILQLVAELQPCRSLPLTLTLPLRR